MIKIIKYTDDFYQVWNDFLKESKNSTFLFHRNFMDYHKDRFSDHSLMVWNNDKLAALLPANAKNKVLSSHDGLSYGGLVISKKEVYRNVVEYLKEILFFLNQSGFEKIIIKELPIFYNLIPSDELKNIIFRVNGKLIKQNITSTIYLGNKLNYQKRKIRSIKKAKQNKLEISNLPSLDIFWNKVLTPNLLSKHNVKPVHNLEEINNLMLQFPDNIKLFSVKHNKEMIAGTVIFETSNVAHAQYIATTEKGRQMGALDFLFDHLINHIHQNKAYFDFGISNENDNTINYGLLEWKEGFGARTFVHNIYEIKPKNYKLLLT